MNEHSNEDPMDPVFREWIESPEAEEMYQVWLESHRKIHERNGAVKSHDDKIQIQALERGYTNRDQVVNPNTQLISLPTSVRQNLESATRVNPAVNTLATTNPELAAILIAEQRGYTEITMEVTEESAHKVWVERSWWRGGSYLCPGQVTTKTVTKKLKLS